MTDVPGFPRPRRAPLDTGISFCLETGRNRILSIAAALILVIVCADWAIGNTVSLGILYILPATLAAVVQLPVEKLAVALLCSALRSCFDTPGSRAEMVLRFFFAAAAYFGAGLFVTALVRNRELIIHHLAAVEREQALRREAEQQLQLLVESSPAGILTLDSSGRILAGNGAAGEIFALPPTTLPGTDIGPYLPVLSDALQVHASPENFRTAAQCYGRRHNGEVFLANTWFSTYSSAEGRRLAANRKAQSKPLFACCSIG